jgi:hypothetical protein
MHTQQLSIIDMAACLRVERLVRQKCYTEDGAAERLLSSCRWLQQVAAEGRDFEPHENNHAYTRAYGEWERRHGHTTWMQLLLLLEGYTSPLESRRFRCAAASLGQKGHSLLCDGQGRVWSFGSDSTDGRLGLGDAAGRLLPHRIPVPLLPPAASVACGGMARASDAPHAGAGACGG